MKSRRNVVAVLALLAILTAGPAAADWENPDGTAFPSAMGSDDMTLAASFGVQILQAAF